MTNIDTDTNTLIKNIATDIICITTIWGLLNNPYMALSNKFLNTTPICITTLGIGISLFVIKKYF
jgi:hypothetical protein